MTPDQTDLVQASFAKIAPIAEAAAVLFYDDLFKRDPSLRSMFPPDMSEQRKKLVTMLAVAVANLKTWDEVSTAVQALGKRHVTYGVRPDQYATVGASLIATLQQGLGSEFTDEVKEAWLACYAAVSSEMLRGANASA